jgi:hypothetical protein
MAEGMKNNLACEDIVAKPVLMPPDAPLPFAGFQASQFFDGMPSGAAMRVFREDDADQFLQRIQDFLVSLGKLSEFSFKGWRRDYTKCAVSLWRSLLGRLEAHRLQEGSGIPALAAAVFFAALSNLRLNARLLQFQVVFQFISAQKSSYRDAVLFQNEVFAIHMSASGHLPQIDARLGDRNASYDSSHSLSLGH